MRWIPALLALLAMQLGATGLALAATCSLDADRAYEVAAARGWKFQCVNGVLSFDNRKRPGCTAKPVLPKAWEEVRFFSTDAPLDNQVAGLLKGGWTLDRYEVGGGSWVKKGTGRGTKSARVIFTFETTSAKYTRRYVSKLVVSKQGGNCSNALNEAF